ncbi:hypothetical protein D3C80_935970 [compost metagenome]
MRPGYAQKAASAQFFFHAGRHAVIGFDLALLRPPEMMGDKFQQQSFRRGKGEGAAGGGHRPGFEIGEIRGQCAQRVFAHAFIDQMAQCLDILIGQDFGQPVAPVHRQNGGNRVECFGAPFDGGNLR